MNDACAPTGTSGSWNAATGSSQGWQEWISDLSAYAGQQVEVSISYASDWSNQGIGVFLDVARALGFSDQFLDAVDPLQTELGKARAGQALPKRVRH